MTTKPSDVCRTTGFQACHHCDDLDCGDNTGLRPARVTERELLRRLVFEGLTAGDLPRLIPSPKLTDALVEARRYLARGGCDD